MTTPDPTLLGTLPHCDASVVHAPGECRYCDDRPDLQAIRDAWGIAYTGHAPADHQVPCPSDARRGQGQAHRWTGNAPMPVGHKFLDAYTWPDLERTPNRPSVWARLLGRR